MKKIVFLMISLASSNYLFSQKSIIKLKEECNGTYWLEKHTDQNNKDSVRIFGSIKRINVNPESDPYGYLILNGKKYYADRNGNFDFKIKSSRFSLFAKNPYTYGISIKPMNFYIGVSYQFIFYLKGLPPRAD